METVVLVPALATTAGMWQPQVTALSGTHEVVVASLPGHGAAPGPFTLAAATRNVTDAIDAAGGPVLLCGISLGATVAVLACLARPGRVHRLVLSGGVAHPPPALAVQRAISSVLPMGVLARIAGAQQGPDGAADLRAVGKGTYLAGLRELAHLDLRPRLGEIEVPALVVCGERDKVNLPLSRELAAGIPGAELRIIPGAGHLWNLEQPDVFTALLLPRVG
ncbi:alpha/beta fold hydrolase [Dactylosporangium sp. CS-033363]|uniref:alpha/beta fold hydrolase n=1 Tax=Dactylosporangium sp. CS-033363 TaxID=3239935 RepID=UPI003D9438D4